MILQIVLWLIALASLSGAIWIARKTMHDIRQGAVRIRGGMLLRSEYPNSFWFNVGMNALGVPALLILPIFILMGTLYPFCSPNLWLTCIFASH